MSMNLLTVLNRITAHCGGGASAATAPAARSAPVKRGRTLYAALLMVGILAVVTADRGCGEERGFPLREEVVYTAPYSPDGRR
ncbi:MAG: hypothetical protein LBC88_10260, partial [Spirochaetaceae bacterium]|nr:hypothetical protein [Spirochaetaceae bacterium]